MLKESKRQFTLDQILLANAVDRLSVLCWQRTKDGAKGKNKPKPLSEIMFKSKEETDIQSFDSAEDFERHRKEIIERNRHE